MIGIPVSPDEGLSESNQHNFIENLDLKNNHGSPLSSCTFNKGQKKKNSKFKEEKKSPFEEKEQLSPTFMKSPKKYETKSIADDEEYEELNLSKNSVFMTCPNTLTNNSITETDESEFSSSISRKKEVHSNKSSS